MSRQLPALKLVNFELPEEVFGQLVALSENYGLSMDELLAEGIRRGLPALEREILGEQFVGGRGLEGI